MKTKLSTKQQQELKAKAHHLKPVVMIGDKGLTENILTEVDIALTSHELIKVKINGADRDQRNAIAEEISEKSEACLVQMIGRILVLYRKRPD
jgi:RNA-binding protein